MTPEQCLGGKVAQNVLCNCDVGQKHHLFNHLVGFPYLVHANIQGVMSFGVNFKLDFWRGKRQGTPVTRQGLCSSSAHTEDYLSE